MTRLVSLEGVILLGGFFGVIAWRLFTGGINLDYLLNGKLPDCAAEYFSPGRVQMLVVSIFAAGYYVIQIIHDPTKFPDIPNSWIIALGGSQAIYLGGKANSMLTGFRNLTDRKTTNEK